MIRRRNTYRTPPEWRNDESFLWFIICNRLPGPDFDRKRVQGEMTESDIEYYEW